MATKTTTKRKPVKADKHARAAGQTQISISLGKDLLEKIDECAEADNRTRSNWIVQKLNVATEQELR